jgi:O-antigen ligase
MASIGLARITSRSNKLLILAACIVAGVGIGAAVTLVNPLFLVGGVLALPVALWLIGGVTRALFTLVAVIAVLPRFALPFRVGITPTFLDLAVVGLIGAWALHQLGPNPNLTLRRSAIAIPVLLLIVAAIATFVVGLPNGALTPLVLRRFAELVLSLSTVLLITALIPDLQAQERLVRWLLLLGALAASIAIGLYVLPDEFVMRALSALRPFGYPTGPEVLRFIRDDPTLMQRATGLWIDPNAFGGFLLIVGALGLPQLFSCQPIVRRALVVLCMSLIGLALMLTVSRGAMLGLASVAVLMGLVRYRRLLVLAALVFGLMMILPQTRELVGHFIDGFAGRDLATQMRFGEYKDAFRLIERYPVFGVGFTGSPDVDLYVGVSSMYLLIAQQMGLFGLAMFVVVILVLFVSAVRAWPQVQSDDRACAIFLGAHGAVLGALFSGIFDHYFFNIDFHNSVMLLWMVIALAAANVANVSTTKHIARASN